MQRDQLGKRNPVESSARNNHPVEISARYMLPYKNQLQTNHLVEIHNYVMETNHQVESSARNKLLGKEFSNKQ